EHSTGAQLLAVLQAYALSTAIIYQHFGDARVGADGCAMCLGSGGQGKANAPHAATYISPHAFLAVDLAKHVVPHDVDRTGRLRSNNRADNSRAGKSGTQVVGLEILLKQIVEAAKH